MNHFVDELPLMHALILLVVVVVMETLQPLQRNGNSWRRRVRRVTLWMILPVGEQEHPAQRQCVLVYFFYFSSDDCSSSYAFKTSFAIFGKSTLSAVSLVALCVCVQLCNLCNLCKFSLFLPFFTFLFLLLLSLFPSRPRVHTLATAVHTPLAMPSTLVVTVTVVVATTMMILMIFPWEFFHLRIVVLVNKLHRLPVVAAAEEHLLVVAVIGNKTTPLQWMMRCLRVQIFQLFVVVETVRVKHHDETPMHLILFVRDRFVET